MEPVLKLEAKVKGLIYDPDRHGNDRYYFRRKGFPKVRLREPYGSDEFREELRCAELGVTYTGLQAPAKPKPTPLAKAGSFKWLCLQYLERARSEWDAETHKRKSKILTEICESTNLSTSGIRNGELAYAGMQIKHVATLRDEWATKPDAANRRVKNISAMFNWAIGAGIATHNPADKCAKLKTASLGFHTWTVEEIRQYLAFHKPGTKAHLWLLILLFTGLRKSDAVQLGRFHLRNVGGERRIVMMPSKTKGSSQVTIDIPLLQPLAIEIDALPASQTAFMAGPSGKAHSGATIGNYMRDWCDQAQLPHCSAHGLRKAGAVIVAEAGATSLQLQALFGWTTSQQADRYTKAASRKRLASDGAAMLKLPAERS